MTAPDQLNCRRASAFSLEQLTALYNQTRTDYIVPMPMNVARLREYLLAYDVDLERSAVALLGETPLGLAMLGLRPGLAWVTRLGVLPGERQHGVGRALMRALLAWADAFAPRTRLEVIENNTAAHQLFLACGFVETRRFLVLRRPPGPLAEPAPATVDWLDRSGALDCLASRTDAPSWVTDTRSLANSAYQVAGLRARLADGGAGWLVYQHEQRGKFIATLTHLIVQTESGAPAAVTRGLLAALYQRYPDLDTEAENLPVADPITPAFQAAGFIEAFRRIEMERALE